MAIQISGGVQLSGPVLLDPTGGSPSPSPSPGGGGASNFGYVSGGSYTNTIQKFSFSSDGNATDVGDLTSARNGGGASSSVSGYTFGGYSTTSSSATNIIDKFTFVSDGNATDVGDLLAVIMNIGSGNSSADSGYGAGGNLGAPTYAQTSTIQKFSFSADGNATDVGDLTTALQRASGQNSSISGYTSGGTSPSGSPAEINTIQKFSFASDGNATDVGDLSNSLMGGSGQSSSDNGYCSGGGTPSNVNTIDKFPFASDANATDVGDLTSADRYKTGVSSSASGYASGGDESTQDIIEKFSFASDGNASDIGDLFSSSSSGAGQQY